MPARGLALNDTTRVDPRHREDPRRALGRLGEDLALAHLKARGFSILARNVRTRRGEIDLIAYDGETLVFVEVKTARAPDRAHTRAQTDPLCWLGGAQRARLRRLAAAWLSQEDRPRPRADALRFDAIGVTVDRDGALVGLDHREGAW